MKGLSRSIQLSTKRDNGRPPSRGEVSMFAVEAYFAFAPAARRRQLVSLIRAIRWLDCQSQVMNAM